ncbi:diacylglycerol acyltransferase-domain-containing protein [Xylaria digitata]|nr:diacylglycerol acyltransferase-domain-containing protein [Xylaria digitata]
MAEDTSVAELKQPKTNGTSPRYFYLVSRKSSQSSPLGLKTGNTGERETKRSQDLAKCHRREPSSASQESYDTPIPDSPLSANKASASKGGTPRVLGDVQPSVTSSDSHSRTSKTATIASRTEPPLAETPSRIPGIQGFKGSSPRQLFKKPSLNIPANSNIADPVDNKPITTSMASKQPEPGRSYLREESYVNIDDMPAQPADGEDSVIDQPLPKANDLTGKDRRELGEGQVHDDATSASTLRPSLYGDDTRKDQDDDDSYPELDDMGIEEIHQLPPRKPNGGIRWAPWNVPFKRRGQTLVVLMHSLSIVATVSLFFAFCANPFAWPLLLIYLLHVLSSKAATDGTLKYRSEWFRKSYIWHFFADYYPARLHKTHDLPETRKYIFGYHPHGIISHGAWAAFATDALGFSEKFPGITNSLLTLDSNFRIPFYREYILSMGVRSVSKESIVNILNKGGPNGEGMGRGVTIVVGGARESLEAQPGMMRLIMRERKGFIKLAVRCGADLVPVLAFGENDLYDQLQPQEHPFMHRIQMFILKVWKFTLPFLHGRGIFNYDVGLMPYRRPLNIVVGAPIKVRQSSLVSLEEINRLHSLYVAELEKLWDRYKDEFSPDRKEELQILP